MIKTRILFLGLVLVAVVALCPNKGLGDTAVAAKPIRDAAERLTNAVLDYDRTSISFGEIKNGSNASGNSGPGIRAELMLASQEVNRLRRHDGKKHVSIDGQSSLKVSGVNSVIDHPDDLGRNERERLLSVEVKVKVMDGAEAVQDLTFFLNRGRDVVVASGLTVQLDPDGGRRDNHIAIRKVIKKINPDAGQKTTPTFTVEGTKIKTSASSPFAVELVTCSAIPGSRNYTPRGPRSNTDSLPFVPINTGEIYGVKIYNNADHDIAVGLKIDGIDQFTFSEDKDPRTGRPRFSTWIIRKKTAFTIKGWHRTSDPSRVKEALAAFKVMKYGDGVFSEFASHEKMADVGVIAVSIAKSHPPGSRATGETGFGPPVEQAQKVIQCPIDPPHEFISIRYNR